MKKIDSLEDYQLEYKRSVENPEDFFWRSSRHIHLE